MGVYPEPALRADDVNRLVPCATVADDEAASRQSRSPLARGIAALTAGLTLMIAAPQTVRAYDSAVTAPMSIPSMVRADLRPADATPEWGGTALLGQDGGFTAPIERMQASLADPHLDGEDATLRFGDMSVSRPLVETIVKASEATGVDPVYMMALADKESSFDATVKSSASSAQGLFQFVTGTWLEMIRQYGAKHGLADEAAAVKGHGSAITIADVSLRKRVLDLRNDPYISGLMAGELIKRDRSRIEARIGRELKTTELYLAHFLGTASAGKFLSLSAESPDRVAKKVFGRAARANRSIFTAKDGAKRRSLTVAEVHEKLDDMIDRRLNQYQAIADLAAKQAGEPAEPILDARLRLNDSVAPSLALHSVQ